eukprot:NODE_460_length_8176_cov_0.585737.p1 type:complete len:517 gc:universal NODE_460_length_8176_cov_0.585737:2003-3553(+)
MLINRSGSSLLFCAINCIPLPAYFIFQTTPDMHPSHRRVFDLLDAMRQECDVLIRNSGDADINTKLQMHLQDLQHYHSTIIELEKQHLRMKQYYEDELKKKGASSSAFPIQQQPSTPQHQQQTQQLPQIATQLPLHATAGLQQLTSNSVLNTSSLTPSSAYKQPKMNQLSQMPIPLQQQQQQQVQQQPQQPTGASDTISPAVCLHFYNASDINSIPPKFKITGEDWEAAQHPKLNRKLNLAHINSFGHSTVVCCVRFSKDGKLFATGCNPTAQVFNTSTGRELTQLSDNLSQTALYVRALSFSPDSVYLATGAEDRIVRIWNIQTSEVSMRLQGHKSDIYSLEFSPDGLYVLSGSGDKTCKIWLLSTGECLHTFENPDMNAKDSGVTGVCWHPNQTIVACGSLDRTIRIWEVETGVLLDTLVGHTDSVYSIAISPDGQYLASGSLDKTLKYWKLGQYAGETKELGQCLKTLSGHKDFVLSVSFTNDGNHILSASKDRTVQYWNPVTGESEFILQGI